MQQNLPAQDLRAFGYPDQSCGSLVMIASSLGSGERSSRYRVRKVPNER